MLFYTASAGHWTVIREVTDNELILFDSKKTRNLKKEICTTTELSESKTRLIIPTMSFLIQKS
jgi:ferredoxin-fold anticodon binding domain-containing protein